MFKTGKCIDVTLLYTSHTFFKGNGRTMEGVGGLNVNVTGIKRGSAKNVTAVGLKFN